MNLDSIKSLIELVASAAIIIGGGAYAVSLFFSSKKTAVKDDLETQNDLTLYLKNQIETYKEMIREYDQKMEERNKEFDKKYNELGKELAALKATSDEKDKTIAKYLEVLQNRNPELDQFIKDSRAKWDQQINIISQVLQFMKNINEHMNKQNQDLKIEATVSHNI